MAQGRCRQVTEEHSLRGKTAPTEAPYQTVTETSRLELCTNMHQKEHPTKSVIAIITTIIITVMTPTTNTICK